MSKLSIVLCSYSHGLGNGIAHIDESIVRGVDQTRFSIKPFVLRPDFPSGRREVLDGFEHISLAGAFPVLCEELRTADILQVNGALDPVACNAAVVAGVPGIIEVMHQVEPGGLHEGLDAVVCVSDLVRSVQVVESALTIHNGIDTARFSFQPGRRRNDTVRVVQVSNDSKLQHYELAEVVARTQIPSLYPFTVGDRPPVGSIPSLGVVQNMPAIFHDADLLFLIEKGGAFGLVFAEAMACGTLPIASADSGAASYIRHGVTGWIVDPTKPGHAEEILIRATDTVVSSRFQEMQKKARSVVEERFSHNSMLAKYQNLYTALGGRKRKEPRQEAAWMYLALTAQLARQGKAESVDALERFLAEPRVLESYFLRHPIGQSVVAFVLERFCPELLASGCRPMVALLCARLRRSRIVSPLLDNIEKESGIAH